MQNCYVGDIGDFANNGLLRWLTGVTSPDSKENLRLGVVQYTRPDQPSHGGHIGYLSQTRENEKEFKECDAELYSALKDLVFKDKRKIKAAQRMFKRRGILPPGTLYYDRELPSPPRKETRDGWLKGAVKAIEKADADIVFLNPDNGIASPKRNPYSPQHIYMDELKCFADAGQGKSLVIYHSENRERDSENRNRDQQISCVAKRLHCNLNLPVHVLRWNRWTARYYFIVAQPDHECVIKKRLTSLRDSPWFKHRKFTEPLASVPCSP